MKFVRAFFSILFLALFFNSVYSVYGFVSDSKVTNFSTLNKSDQREKIGNLARSKIASNITIAAAFEAGEGEAAKTQGEKISSWCHALSLYGVALERNPYDARTLLNWANLRQLLGEVSCPGRLTKGNFSEAAASALMYDPSNVNNRYIAGLLLHWGGKVEEAAQQFEFVLRYGVGLDELRRNQIFAIASKPDLLRTIVPARTPQALQYLAWFEQQYKKGEYWSEELFDSETLTAFKADTFSFLETAIIEKKLQKVILLDQIQQMENLSLKVSEIQRIDQMYLKLTDTNEQNGFSELLKVRGALTPLLPQLGLLSIDTRIPKTGITRWGINQEGVFDTYHASLGIFTKNGDIPQLIEVRCGLHSSLDLQAEQIQLYLSEDNLAFREVTGETTIKSVRNGLQAMFSIDTKKLVLPPAAKGRYWKVHFNGTSRQAYCRAPLRTLVRVYGSAGTPSDEAL